MILLVSHVGVQNTVTNSQSLVDTLLWPVVEVLTTINSHAYMSTEKADRALEILVKIVDEYNNVGLYGMS